MDKKQELVESVLKDLAQRQQERKSFEACWQLNLNFLMGNQYCTITGGSEVEDFEKQFFWQEREVFNHIAQIVEARLAKLQKVRPVMSVVPAGSEDGDLKSAKLCKKILQSTCNSQNFSQIIEQATKWSEICGTSFYKVVWNTSKGEVVAKSNEGKIFGGDVEICAISPFEIYPDNSCAETLDDVQSLIHTKCFHIDDIKNIYGVDVEGGDINVFSFEKNSNSFGGLGYSAFSKKIVPTLKKDSALVVEKYIRPNKEYPKGRLLIIAGEQLVFDGDLPFVNGKNGKRDFPFVRQLSIEHTNSFWGVSVIERLIPVQRAYNAVKNRKQEFLNRVTMGVLTVEDGSVDTDNLEDEGVSPGKILVYRQGSSAPRYMATNSVPTDFAREEQMLLSEFLQISGTSELLSSSSAYASLSGVALQMLIEQDDSRLSPVSNKIKACVKQVGEFVLRLFKQFASVPRLTKIANESGEIETFYFCGSDISSDDVVFETDNEITESLAQRRSMVFDLLNAGLLHDENGKLSKRMRMKALDLLGFGIWESASDLNELHTKKAARENVEFLSGKKLEVSVIDDHEMHTNEHIAFLLSSQFDKQENKKELEEKMIEHINMHKKMLSLESEMRS